MSRSSLVELLLSRARTQPEHKAFTFLEDGESQESSLTFSELSRRAQAIAAQLQSRGARGERVLLLYPPGLDYVCGFFGCLYAGAIAVPAYPPDPMRLQRSVPRLQAIVRDARAKFALSTSGLLAMAETVFDQAPDLRQLQWLATDELTSDREVTAWVPPDVQASSLAFIQYTSGSTGTPKGVMLTHGNLLHNEQLIQMGFGHGPETRVVGWLPLYHDMGLIGNLLQPVYLGTSCVLMSPLDFLQRPLRWLQAISKYRATTSGGPNFAYELCVRKVSEAEKKELDLSSWTVAFNGAEPVRADTLERFAQAFAGCGFRMETFLPCYGLAESALVVTAGPRAERPRVHLFDQEALTRGVATRREQAGQGALPLVGCGQTIGDERILIVAPESRRPASPGSIGEIWVSSPSVAQGYWEQPELTQQVFGARLASGEGPFLRTGDLGFWSEDQLFIAGRQKDLIIIRGRNYAPQDIERCVEQAEPAVRPGCSAAFSLDTGAEERLVAVFELDPRRASEPTEILAHIRRELAEQLELVPHAIVLIKSGTLPKTSSGKVQRFACRNEYLNDTLDVVAAWTASEEKPAMAAPRAVAPVQASTPADPRSQRVAQCVAGALSFPGTVALDRPVTELGLDSRLAAEVQWAIEREFQVRVSLSHLLAGPTINELAREIAGQTPSAPAQVAPPSSSQRAGGEHPLSYGQRGLWFLDRLIPGRALYNISSAVRMSGKLDAGALGRAFRTICGRHPALRTVFPEGERGPMQVVQPDPLISFEVEPVASDAALDARMTAEAERAFDLESGPLLRVRLFKRSAREHVMLVVIHHIIADLWSLSLVLDELQALYQQETLGQAAQLPEPSRSYADFVDWQRQRLSSGGEELWRFWSQQLTGKLPVLAMPTDKPRPPMPTGAGSRSSFRISGALAERLRTLSRQEGVTPYVTLLACFYALLSRITGQEDLIVGSPFIGRPRGFERTVGYFINTLPLRANLSANPQFRELIQSVRKLTSEALEHQDFPLSQIVERLNPVREQGRNPLFQAMLIWKKSQLSQSASAGQVALEGLAFTPKMNGLTLEAVPLNQREGVAKVDLELEFAELGSDLLGVFTYSTDLFEAATIERLGRQYVLMLERLMTDPELRVADVSLRTDTEGQPSPKPAFRPVAAPLSEEPVHHFFERSAARTPDAIALVAEGVQWTYDALNRVTNKLAHVLKTKGVGPNTLCSIALPRSAEMVIAVLAVAKAGGGYVGLDPSYPRDRLAFMLEESRSVLVLTTSEVSKLLPEGLAPRMLLDAEWMDQLGSVSDANLAPSAQPDDLLYVTYTSGSTGKPKGVAMPHRPISNLIVWQTTVSTPGLRVFLLFAPIGFDVSAQEIFSALVGGGKLVLATEEIRRDPRALLRLIAAEKVELLSVPFVALQQLAEAAEAAGVIPDLALRVVIAAGEQLQTTPQIRALFARLPQCRLYNQYGPSETHVSNEYQVPAAISDWELLPPIGAGITAVTMHVLDANLRPVPDGVQGELFIGGVAPARGYLFRPDATAERFLPDPFSDVPGSRLYRTGDLASLRPDGVVEFFGRADQQVKIRGFRVELGEVESALRTHPGIRDIAVALKAPDGEPLAKRLVAYVVPKAGESAPTAESLRAHIQRVLPEYMVPADYVELPALPVLPSGKINRRGLPNPPSRPEPTASSAQGGSLERQLHAIWCAVLEIPSIDPRENFFAVGGHSVAAARVCSRIQAQLGVEVPVRVLYEAPTLRALTEYVASKQTKAPARAPAEAELIPVSKAKDVSALTAAVDTMSEDELNRLLGELEAAEGSKQE